MKLIGVLGLLVLIFCGHGVVGDGGGGDHGGLLVEAGYDSHEVGFTPLVHVFKKDTGIAVRDTTVDTCVLTCIPKLCVGDAVLFGTTTHLTYICPETVSSTKAQSTVYVTITEMITVVPTTTVVATSLGAAATSADELTTTITIEMTSTLFETITVHRPNASSTRVSAIPSSPMPIASETASSSSLKQSYSSKSEGQSTTRNSSSIEPVTTITEHHVTTAYITLTTSGPSSQFQYPWYSLKLTSTLNGTIMDGVSYTRTTRNSSYAPSYAPTGTISGHYAPLHGRAMTTSSEVPEATGLSASYVELTTTVTIYSTITLPNSTKTVTSTMHRNTSVGREISSSWHGFLSANYDASSVDQATTSTVRATKNTDLPSPTMTHKSVGNRTSASFLALALALAASMILL